MSPELPMIVYYCEKKMILYMYAKLDLDVF